MRLAIFLQKDTIPLLSQDSSKLRMADYHKGGGGFKGKGGFKPHSDRGFGGRKELYTAECANCHKSCEVPFRPSGDRPVYCRDCFGDKPDMPRKEFGRPQGPRSFDRRPTPSFGKPEARDTRIDDIKRDVASLSAKLDAVIATLEGLSTTKAKKVQAVELTAAVKKVTKKKPAKKK